MQSQSPLVNDLTENEPEGTDRTDINVLPAAALKLALTGDMVLRAAYGMTVGRPQIRELAPYQYYDFLRDRNVQGNPELRGTTIHNADLRWEWYPRDGEIVAASAFFKRFIDPIELQSSTPTTTTRSSSTPRALRRSAPSSRHASHSVA